MPQCLKCNVELPVNEEGGAAVLCDRCAGVANSRAQRTISTDTLEAHPATTALIAINVLIAAAMFLTGGFNTGNLLRWGANFGPLTLGGDYWRLLTAGFVHGGMIHIAFNMWCLWGLGRLSEKLFGTWITVAVYILTSVAGSLLSVAWHHNRFEVGASGAIFGIAGAILSGIKFGDVSISSSEKRSITSSLLFFAGFNLFIGMGPGIDNLCHIGGFLSGLILGVPLARAAASGQKRFGWSTVILASLTLVGLGVQLVKVTGGSIQGQLARAEVAIQLKQYPAAIQILEKYVSSRPDDSDALTMLGELYAETNQKDKAILVFERVLQANPNSDEANQALQEMRRDVPTQH